MTTLATQQQFVHFHAKLFRPCFQTVEGEFPFSSSTAAM
jgi:hypothetical protein